ncbi:MAG: hypothetical protein RLY71_972, partial [Pseudomonadota bacterium]
DDLPFGPSLRHPTQRVRDRPERCPRSAWNGCPRSVECAPQGHVDPVVGAAGHGAKRHQQQLLQGVGAARRHARIGQVVEAVQQGGDREAWQTRGEQDHKRAASSPQIDGVTVTQSPCQQPHPTGEQSCLPVCLESLDGTHACQHVIDDVYGTQHRQMVVIGVVQGLGELNNATTRHHLVA